MAASPMDERDEETGLTGAEVVAMFDARLRGYLRQRYTLCAAVPFATKEVADAIQRLAIQRSNRGHISGADISARVSELEALDKDRRAQERMIPGGPIP